MKQITIPYGSTTCSFELPDTSVFYTVPNPKKNLIGLENNNFSDFINLDQTTSLASLIAVCASKNTSFTVGILLQSQLISAPYFRSLVLPTLQYLETQGLAKPQIRLFLGLELQHSLPTTETNHFLGEYQMFVHASNSAVVPSEFQYLGDSMQLNQLFTKTDLKISIGVVHYNPIYSGATGALPLLINIASLQSRNQALRRFLHTRNTSEQMETILPSKPEFDFGICTYFDEVEQMQKIACGTYQALKLFQQPIEKEQNKDLNDQYDLIIYWNSDAEYTHFETAFLPFPYIEKLADSGKIAIVVHNSVNEPVGSKDYKHKLRIVKDLGFKEYFSKLHSTNEVNEADLGIYFWGQLIEKIGSENKLVYCSMDIPRMAYAFLPGLAGLDFLDKDAYLSGKGNDEGKAQAVSQIIGKLIESLNKDQNKELSILLVNNTNALIKKG